MVTRTKARILESFQTRKLQGNNGNVRCNEMEKDGLVARAESPGDENVCSFSSNKGGGWGLGSRWMVGSTVKLFQLLASRLVICGYISIVLCLREPPPQPSDLIWYHPLFSIPKVSEGFLSSFFLLKHMSQLMIICEINRSHSEPKGSPKVRF